MKLWRFAIGGCFQILGMAILVNCGCNRHSKPNENNEVSKLRSELLIKHLSRDPSGISIELLAAKYSLTTVQVRKAAELFSARQSMEIFFAFQNAKTVDEVNSVANAASDPVFAEGMRKLAAEESIPIERLASLIYDYAVIRKIYGD